MIIICTHTRTTALVDILNLIQKLYESQPFLSQINNHENKLEGFNNILNLTTNDAIIHHSFKSKSVRDIS